MCIAPNITKLSSLWYYFSSIIFVFLVEINFTTYFKENYLFGQVFSTSMQWTLTITFKMYQMNPKYIKKLIISHSSENSFEFYISIYISKLIKVTSICLMIRWGPVNKLNMKYPIIVNNAC